MADSRNDDNGESKSKNEEVKPDSSEINVNTKTVEDDNLRKSALYQAIYAAYFGTLLEADKSILTISAGGVGLLVTLMTAFELNSITHIIIYLLALTLFVISIVACIFVFKRNRIVLHKILMKKNEEDSLLKFLDYLSITCCILGIVATIAIGVAAGIQKINKKSGKEPETLKAVQVNTLNGNLVIQPFGRLSTIYGGKKHGR